MRTEKGVLTSVPVVWVGGYGACAAWSLGAVGSGIATCVATESYGFIRVTRELERMLFSRGLFLSQLSLSFFRAS